MRLISVPPGRRSLLSFSLFWLSTKLGFSAREQDISNVFLASKNRSKRPYQINRILSRDCSEMRFQSVPAAGGRALLSVLVARLKAELRGLACQQLQRGYCFNQRQTSLLSDQPTSSPHFSSISCQLNIRSSSSALLCCSLLCGPIGC